MPNNSTGLYPELLVLPSAIVAYMFMELFEMTIQKGVLNICDNGQCEFIPNSIP